MRSASILLVAAALGQIEVLDEGARKGVAPTNKVDCRGANVSCTISGSAVRITVVDAGVDAAAVSRSWARTGSCPSDGGNCTLVDSYNITSVVQTSPGYYTVTYPTLGDTNYGTLATASTSAAWCTASATNATTAAVSCYQITAAEVGVPPYASVSVSFTVQILDNN